MPTALLTGGPTGADAGRRALHDAVAAALPGWETETVTAQSDASTS